MKKIFFLFLILICLYSTAQKVKFTNVETVPTGAGNPVLGTLAYMDLKNGYKDLHFGMDLKELSKVVKLKFTDSSMGDCFYDVQDLKYFSVGECKFSKVFITIFKGKLHQVFITTANNYSSACLLETLKGIFGPGQKSTTQLETYLWAGRVVSTLYSENLSEVDATVVISGNEISGAYEANRIKSSQNRGSDF